MNQRRVGIFCEKWESGGIESFLFNVLTHMDLETLEVDIIVAQLGSSVFTESLRARGVHFRELSGSQQKIIKNRRLFARLIQERSYDVLHFNLFQGLSMNYIWLAKRAGVPVRIAHSHNTALRKSPTRPLKLVLHRLARALFTRSATELWACSQAAAAFLFSPAISAKKAYRFIPNGIKTDRFLFDGAYRQLLRHQLGFEGQFVVGTVGRLCSQKNQDFTLDVFAELLKQRPESFLLLIGEGDLENYLKEKVVQLGIAHRVIFYGVTNQVEQLMWVMDAFLFPSLFEGLGIVAVEAQASGLPVLCSQHIPEEAHVTDFSKCLKLESGALCWSRELLDFSPSMNRAEGAMLVRKAGFDVCSVATLVECEYLRGNHE